MYRSFEQVKPLFRWQIGNGERTPISSVNWFQPIQNLDNLQKVSELMDSHGYWNHNAVRTLYNPDDASAIINTITSTCGNPDCLIFQPSNSGSYTVKEGYNAFANLNQDLTPAASNPNPIN